jgi:FAD/FMN-containing dehydrogenase
MPTHPALTCQAFPQYQGLAGKTVRPGGERYDLARSAWNLAVDQRPAAVVLAETADDVRAAVRLAAGRGLRIAAQGTGHLAMPLGDLSDTLLLKTERMRGVRIDPAARIARAEAGVVWLQVVEAAARHGLAGLAGSSPDVGVVGYTLGGGLSFLGRKHGLAASHVHAIELVTADGRLIRADREHEPDLFWALRGGGGSFGIVTAIEFGLLPVRHMYAGHLWYPIERGAEVLHAWAELTRREIPDELTTVGRFWRFPLIPDIPEEMRGKSFVTVEAYHLGEIAQADELLAPLRALGPVNDTIAAVPLPAVSHLHLDPEHPVPYAGDGMLLADLPSAAVNAFVQVSGATAAFPLLSAEIRHLGGELARPHPGNGALASIDARYVLHAIGMTPSPEATAAVMTQVGAAKRALAPWGARQMYLNFAETARPTAPLWTDHAYQRLCRIKAAVDPAGLIRANHPVPLAVADRRPGH